MAQADGAGIAIRRLRAGDAEIWRDLRIECLTRHPAAFGASAEAEGARSLDLWRAGLERDCVLGAFDGSALAGTAAYRREVGEKHAHVAHIGAVYVRPAYRGRRIARRLIETIIAGAHGQAEHLHLQVAAFNSNARHLYESLGFREAGRTPGVLRHDGGDYDEILMLRRV